MLKLGVFALAALVAMPASAQIVFEDSPPAQVPAKVTTQSDLDKIVCKTLEKVGTRLGAHKTCMTVREWKDQEEQTRDAVDRLQQGQGVTPSG